MQSRTIEYMAVATSTPIPDVRPMRSLVLLSASHAVNHAHAIVLPLIFLQLIDEYGVGIDAIAFLAAIGNLSAGLVQLSYAQLTRVVSRRRLLGGGGLLLGGGFIAQAFATSFVTFAVPNVLSRVGGSPQHPVGNGLLAEQFPTHRRGFAISAHIAGGNIGSVAIALLGVPLIAALGWRGTSVLLGLLAALMAIAILASHPRARHRSCRGNRRRQRPTRARAGPRRSRPALAVPHVGARRRRPRPRRRQPLRPGLPQRGAGAPPSVYGPMYAALILFSSRCR